MFMCFTFTTSSCAAKIRNEYFPEGQNPYKHGGNF